MTRKRTISKHFNDDQILGVTYDQFGKREIHLKMGVRKKYNPGYIDYDDCHQRLQVLDNLKNFRELTDKLFGDHEFNNYNNEESFD